MRSNVRWLFYVAAVTLGLAGACTAPDATSVQKLSDMGCTVNAPDPRACDPADTKKTTICHIPPGNPDNAHTICVGNAAVPAHLDHGDFLGTCSCADVDAGAGGGEIDAGDVDGGPGGGPGSGGSDDGGIPVIN
jgi:hypothetical protein